MTRRPTTSEVRAALWAARAVRSARRQLRANRIEGLDLPRVPTVPGTSVRGVRAVIRRLSPTCLERAIVLQRWRAAQGDPHDVVVGVSGSRERFRAHAWLDDEPPADDFGSFEELLRLRP